MSKLTPGIAQAGGQELIRSESLSYRINGKSIIREVSLRVRTGEFAGIIGPNGAGKTTLLRLLLGVLAPDSGRVFLKGRPLGAVGMRERARVVSYLSQDAASPFAFPVIDVVLMGRYPYLGKLAREARPDIEKARRALSYVGLSGFEDRFFNELSGGERQLVLFARVLAQETELLLLDEPTANLDIKHQDRFFSMALELAREGKAVLACVHNLNVASQYCSRLVLLDHGTVAADGKPLEVLKPEILDRVYETRTTVTANASTGSLVVTVVPRMLKGEGPRIHLIGGAGSAVNLTRELARLGYRISGGIAHEFDADEKLWRSLGIECSTVGAFSRISAQDIERSAALVEEAQLTVLCSFPVGPGNAENLRLAARSERLVVLTPGPEDPPRSFFSEEGRSLFQELAAKARRLTRAELLQELESGRVVAAP